VQADDDQAFLLDGLDTSTGRVLRCDSEFCGAYVTAPGPFNRWSAVGWLKHLNINAQCHGNGIDWQSGNTLHVQDSVIEGLQQFAIRSGVARGGYGGTEIDNAYIEQSASCKNPLGNVGQAGVIQQGNDVVIAGVPGGIFPTFAKGGTKEYHYYVVARHGDYYSVPLYAGRAFSTGSDRVPVAWPEIPDADGYDLLRTTYVNGVEHAPYGRGDFKVAGVSLADCTAGACQHTDTNAPLSSYSTHGPSFIPKLSFWPGGLVLSGSGVNSIYAGATAYVESADSNTGIIATQGSRRPAVFAKTCGAMSQYTPIWVTCISQSYAPESSVPSAMLMVSKSFSDGKNLNLKGRVNFGTLGTGPGHIITLYDSDLDKTIATANHRPLNDANDAFIGVDQGDGSPAKYGISFGAPSSLSNYIGDVGDGDSWKERLTSTTKFFRVPITTNSEIISTVPTGKVPLSVDSATPVPTLTVANHPTIRACGKSDECISPPIAGAQIIFGRFTLRKGAATIKRISPGFTSADSFECTASDRTNPAQPASALPVSATSVALSGEDNHLVAYICVGK
jgi:hypothetical protein